MELKELFTYRQQLLDESKDAEGYISDTGFLENCLVSLNETKYTDTTDVTDIYCMLDNGAVKVNAYTLNESGERLQLFIVNEESLETDAAEDNLVIAEKAQHEKQFSRAVAFIKRSIRRQLDEQLQDGSPAWVLVRQLVSPEFLHQVDVIEIFLVSATISARQRTGEIAARAPDFKDETIVVGFQRERERHSKELIIMKRLIDINFLYTIYIMEGSREPLTIDFAGPPYNNPIPCLRAASEEAFDSYLCVLPAGLLAELYKRYSSSLLEKNIRSFLQLKGVNKGMLETVRKEPEKFIAYNNGLTITATESMLEQREGVCYIHSLTDFQIVNGGQTTATLYFSQKLGLNIDPVRVMAKINVAKGATDDMLDDLISSISTYSNAQSRVTRIDLRSRSPQLVKIKSLSESVLTVTGKKWFFERARGEYATLLRNNAGRKAQIEKAFPRERRFVKEELAKYYASWGDKPYLVKKGGEKIFRMFLEELSGEGRNKKEAVIDREFYENLVARIIFFRGLERLYGTGYSAMGQLRSAVVPYTLSVVYAYTTGNKKGKPFDLQKIWKAERLEHDLQAVLRKLMELMNTLIRRYSKSDDLGEYTKKQELWEDIIGSKEIVAFMGGAQVAAILKRYALPVEELKKRKSAAGE